MASRLEKATISRYFNAIERAIPASWGSDPVQDIFKTERKAERQHRSGRPSAVPAPKNFTIADAARYFTVKHILEGVNTEWLTMDIVDVLHYRRPVLLSLALGIKYREQILGQLNQDEIDNFLNHHDYVDLVK